MLDAVKDPRVEIYTGKDDQILRRMVVNLGVEDAASGTSGTIAFDVSLTDLNEDQDIAEPADAKPFSELLQPVRRARASARRPVAAPATERPARTTAARRPGTSRSTPSASPTPADDLDKVRECAELLAAP